MDVGALGQVSNLAYQMTPYPDGTTGLNVVSAEEAKLREEYSQKVAAMQRKLLAAAFASSLPVETGADFVDAARVIEAYLTD